MGVTVSIIVPVYNAENTLRRCVDSVLKQEYTDFELLLINDGSTDASGRICDEYAQQDSRVTVVHKQNSGVSATRNQGIERAQGTYLQFLDSDDWITTDSTKLLVRTAQSSGCDMVIADFYRVVGDRISHRGDIDSDETMTRAEFAEYMMENPAAFYYGALWNKLYRRDIVEKYRLRMNPQLSWCEDFIFNLDYIYRANTFFALRAPVYYYVKTKGSLVSQTSGIASTLRTKLQVFEYYNDFYKHVLDEEEYERKRPQLYWFLLDSASDGVVLPLPSIISGSKKLGSERVSVCEKAVMGSGILTDAYRSRKLMDRCLESAALKNGLTLPAARLMLYLNAAEWAGSKKELADFSGLSTVRLGHLLQELISHDLISLREQTDKKGLSDLLPVPSQTEKRFSVTFLPAAEPVLADLSAAMADYKDTLFDGFSAGELQQYSLLSARMQDNMRRSLL